jgi:hypothetical protein
MWSREVLLEMLIVLQVPFTHPKVHYHACTNPPPAANARHDTSTQIHALTSYLVKTTFTNVPPRHRSPKKSLPFRTWRVNGRYMNTPKNSSSRRCTGLYICKLDMNGNWVRITQTHWLCTYRKAETLHRDNKESSFGPPKNVHTYLQQNRKARVNMEAA